MSCTLVRVTAGKHHSFGTSSPKWATLTGSHQTRRGSASRGGTVDSNEEREGRANDQVELAGGWGAGMLGGTVGWKFSNFSVRNIGNKKAWRPLPTGDGQTLTLRAQTNGSYYQSYSFSFTEPWLGGKKPNSFTFSIYYSKQTSGNSA